MDTLDEQLYRACGAGDLNEAHRSIEAGASVNYVSNRWWSVLHEAVYGRNVEIVRLLLSRGADTHPRSNAHRTALHVAAYSGNLELVELLLQYGIDPTLRSNEGETAEDEARQCGYLEIAEFLSNSSFSEIKEPDCL